MPLLLVGQQHVEGTGTYITVPQFSGLPCASHDGERKEARAGDMLSMPDDV